MSTLSDKILSYGPEQHYTFNETYRLAPTNLGNGGTPANFTLTNETPTYVSSGGLLTEGYWTFPFGTAVGDTTTTRYRNITTSSTQLNTELTDNSFSTGFWFKANGTLLNSSTHTTTHEMAFLGGANSGIRPGIYGGTANNSNKGKLYVLAVGGAEVFSTSRVDDGSWHYFAGIQTTDGTNNTVSIYLDGSLVNTQTYARSASTAQLALGSNTISPNPYEITGFNISNFYIASPTAITGTEIAAIWAEGSGGGATNITITETPATASSLAADPSINVTSNAAITETPATALALMTEPTIAVAAGDHTEITTSIPVSAQFPSNITVTAAQNVNNVITEVLTATVELINNVIISTGTNDSFSAGEFTATALLVEPILPRQPMTASATSGNHNVYVTPNYYSLVKTLDPVIYLYADQTRVPINKGSWDTDWIITADNNVILADSTGKMDGVGYGQSWTTNANDIGTGIQLYTTRTTSPFDTRLTDLFETGNFTYEFWFNDNNVTNTGNFIISDQSQTITIEANKDYVKLLTKYVYKTYIGGYDGAGNPIYYTGVGGPASELTANYGEIGNPYNRNSWNHIAITCENLGTSSAGINAKFSIWINGVFLKTATYNWQHDNNGSPWYSNFIKFDSTDQAPLFDELTIYPTKLDNSEIIANWNFINNLSPNFIYNADSFDASSESGNHNYLITSNVNTVATPITSSALLADPTIIPVKNISYSSQTLTASAQNTDATVYWGWTIYETPATGYIELAPAYALNDFYYNYVQANITPYRYVTFDAQNEYLDYGTDNDYSVVPVSIGGSIVSPALGINGKSAKTSGTAYSEGVILKESEWNDSWGTGQNSYHSAFWFQRAADDASTTGLRVLWNLNGYKDNQHVVLYQYQNKLHMQFNNGSGTWIEQDTGTLDLFDYERHFVVIEFDHTNANNNIVRLYVDAVLKSTINLGAYTGTTTNAITADSGANNEINNHPRLGIGCLITPFASTALPVSPANTKLIIDEVYWDKNAINQTMVTNLYNAMPDKNNTDFSADPMIAFNELVMPALSTSSILSTVPLTASVEAVQPVTTADREVIYTSTAYAVLAEFPAPAVFENKIITSDVLVATAIFNSAGVRITIPGGPMIASISIVKPSLVNNEPISTLTAYVKYLRAQNYYGNQIHRLVEVK